MAKKDEWYEYIYRMPLEVFWLKCLPKYIFKELICPTIPKQILSKYIKKEIYDMVCQHLKTDFYRSFYRKFGKKVLLEYIQNNIGVNTNPLKYTGELKDEVDTCLWCFLNTGDHVHCIDGYIYWITSTNVWQNKNLKKAEILEKHFVHYSNCFCKCQEETIDKNVQEAFKKYAQILKQLRGNNEKV